MVVKVGDLLVGAAVGYAASRVMDQATTWFYGQQSEASRRREDTLAPGGAPMAAGRTLARWAGAAVTDDQAAMIGFRVHRALGMTYGAGAAVVVKAGVRPLVAGIATGAGAFVLVDEGVNSALFTPPPQAYMMESHLRGVVGHAVYGVALGAMLAVASRLRLLGRDQLAGRR